MSLPASRTHPSLNSVLLATDLSETSRKALRHAVAIARHYRAKFYFAHVVSGLVCTLTGPQALELASEAAEREVLQVEHDLLESGSLDGVDHEFLVCKGIVCEELQSIISEERIDLVVLGTHGRRGIEKLLLGSVAEQVFRRANCLVLTVGPNSYPFDFSRKSPEFLFATDFGEGSLCALPHAVSFANHFGAKLTLLHVVPATPMPDGSNWRTADDLMQMRNNARMACVRQLEQLLTSKQELALEPDFIVQFGLPSEKILQVALELKVDLIFLGLRRSSHIAAASHMPWATAYEVVCGARCPVLTVRE
jgi:nucleotide-binding universal stress UspA family protein